MRRNLGTEVFERLIEPFCSGVYAGNAANLSMKAAFGKARLLLLPLPLPPPLLLPVLLPLRLRSHRVTFDAAQLLSIPRFCEANGNAHSLLDMMRVLRQLNNRRTK